MYYRQYQHEYPPEYYECMTKCENPPYSYPSYECDMHCAPKYPPRPSYLSIPYSMQTSQTPTALYGYNPYSILVTQLPWENDPCYIECRRLGVDDYHCRIRCDWL